MNTTSPTTDSVIPTPRTPGSNPAAPGPSGATNLLSAAPDPESISAARKELLIVGTTVGAFAGLLSIVIGIRVFHMADATGIGLAFSVLIAALFCLAILLGMALLVRMHSRGNFLGEQLMVLRAVVQETLDLGRDLKNAAEHELNSSALLEENANASLTEAEEAYIWEFHTHIAGLQAAGQVLGLEHLPTPSKADIVGMAQPIRDDVAPRLATAKDRRAEIHARLEAVTLTSPQAPPSPHTNVYPDYPGKPDINWIDSSVLPDGFTSASPRVS